MAPTDSFSDVVFTCLVESARSSQEDFLELLDDTIAMYQALQTAVPLVDASLQLLGHDDWLPSEGLHRLLTCFYQACSHHVAHAVTAVKLRKGCAVHLDTSLAILRETCDNANLGNLVRPLEMRVHKFIVQREDVQPTAEKAEDTSSIDPSMASPPMSPTVSLSVVLCLLLRGFIGASSTVAIAQPDQT